MNILVTGGNGQLGNEMRIVASKLKTQNSELNFIFTDICELSEEAKSLLRNLGGEEVDTKTTILDITNLEEISKLITHNSIHACVNCAAWTNVDGAEDPAKFELVEKLNATAPENLAKAMKEVGGLLIHISTDYVFGKEPYNIPCREDQKGTPTGVYGLTKLHGEQNIIRVMSDESSVMSDESSVMSDENPKLKTQNSKPGYVIIRTAWLYSEFGKNFCKTMLNLTATKPALKVVFDQCGTPTYAYDLANAIMAIIKVMSDESSVLGCAKRQSRAMSNPQLKTQNSKLKTQNSQLKTQNSKPYTGIYHFSNEGVCSWYDFTKMIQQIDNELRTQNSRPITLCDIQPCHSNEFPSPVTRPSYSVLDKTKIKETFGINIPYWTDSLRKCITNLQNN